MPALALRIVAHRRMEPWNVVCGEVNVLLAFIPPNADFQVDAFPGPLACGIRPSVGCEVEKAACFEPNRPISKSAVNK